MKTLAKSNRFPSLQSMVDDFWNADGFFNKPFFKEEFFPAVNIREKEGSYELEVSAPGFKKDEIKVSAENGMLTISGEASTEDKEEKEGYTRKEFSKSSFSRSFSLPENIMEDEIKAKFSDGLLHISLKKSAAKKSSAKHVTVE